MTREEMAKEIWRKYEDALSLQTSMGLRKSIPEYVDFFEGRQWPAPTRNTKNLPRPVINIVKMICRLKKSAILSSPVRIIYKCRDKRIDIDTFNEFSSFILKEIDQDALDKIAIDDATKKGSYFYHYYWDTENVYEDDVNGGHLRCELIDPLNIFFENPCELDEQKQKWIIIATRERVEDVRKIAETGVNISDIMPDDSPTAYQDGEEKNGLCTVLTMYHRVRGEVFCTRSVKGTVIRGSFPITPGTALALSTGEAEVGNGKRRPVATLYPIVCGYYEKKDRSIYGLSEVEGLIPNQKAINFNIAMSLLNAQEVAWGKYIALPGALKGQTINNAPGQVLIDYSGTGNGIKKMQENYMQSFPVELVKTITDLTRSVTGTSEFMTGEVVGSGMSGTAIARLQSQAQLPIEDLRALFMSVKRKQGRVLAQFYKLFYRNMDFITENKDGDDAIRSFCSRDYENADFEVLVETVSGVNASVAGDISMLDTVLKHGSISLESYISAYPDDALTNKQKILELVRAERVREDSSLQAQVDSLSMQLKKATETIKEQEATVSQVVSIINENKTLKQFISKEYADGK
ncbi:MAG: hypothetical protein IJX51_03375 [Clostridia bacterium]|nr:hypothetical protein [Clostridia bacterium]